jgi:DNA-binding PadR family transcriptional regulator
LAEAEKEIVKATLRGLNRAIILWSISKKPMSGYTVIKEMEHITGQKNHQGIIYPLLYELEKNGFISGEWTQKSSVRIKNYTITENGLKLLEHLREIFSMPIKEAMQDIIGEKTSKKAGTDCAS